MSLVDQLKSRLKRWLRSRPPESDFQVSRVDDYPPEKPKKIFWVTLFKIRW